MSKTFPVRCNQCGVKLKASQKLRGKTISCPKCDTPVYISEPATEIEADDSTAGDIDADPESMGDDLDDLPRLPISNRERKRQPDNEGSSRLALERLKSLSPNLRWGIGCVACLLVGYFAGREHLKYQIQAAFSSFGKQLAEQEPASFVGSDFDSNEPPIVPKVELQDSKPPVVKPTRYGTVAKFGDCGIRTTAVEVKKIPLKSIGGTGKSENEQLSIGIEIENTSERKILTWRSGNRFGPNLITLRDDVGNVIRGVDFGFATEVIGARSSTDDIHPGKTVSHVEIFTVPPSATKSLILEVDGQVMGQDGSAKLEIPANVIVGF